MLGRLLIYGVSVVAAAVAGLFVWDATLPRFTESPRQECLAIARYMQARPRTLRINPVLDTGAVLHADEASGTGPLDCTKIFKSTGLSVAPKVCAPDMLCTRYDLTFSRLVPRAASATEAVVYIDHGCDGMDCGYGSKLTMRRIATVWWVVAEEMTWIS